MSLILIPKNIYSIESPSDKISEHPNNKKMNQPSIKNQLSNSNHIEQKDFKFSIGTINVKINPTSNSIEHKAAPVMNIQKRKQLDLTKMSRYYVRL